MKPALIVIDLQQWFFRLFVHSSPAWQGDLRLLLLKTNELIDIFHRKILPVIHVLTIHQKDEALDMHGRRLTTVGC